MFCRRDIGILAARTLAGLALGPAASAGLRAADPLRVPIAVPGPGNLLFLPITLASRLGLDRQGGIALDIRYVGGGPQAFQDLQDRNVDFAAGGLAALALQRLGGRAVSAIVPTTRVPAYTLLVRKDLRGKVRRTADLAGRVVGVKGHTPGGRSTSQLFTEYVMARAGVSADRLNYVSVGQSYESQHAGLASGAVDAIMGDEPFATRLVRENVAFVLEDYHEAAATVRLLGGLFLNGTVAARDEYLARQPQAAGQVVRVVQQALVWIDRHSASELVDGLRIDGAIERDSLREALVFPPGDLFARRPVFRRAGRDRGTLLSCHRDFGPGTGIQAHQRGRCPLGPVGSTDGCAVALRCHGLAPARGLALATDPALLAGAGGGDAVRRAAGRGGL